MTTFGDCVNCIHMQNPDDIIMTMDLHLTMPTGFIQSIRKVCTFQPTYITYTYVLYLCVCLYIYTSMYVCTYIVWRYVTIIYCIKYLLWSVRDTYVRTYVYGVCVLHLCVVLVYVYVYVFYMHAQHIHTYVHMYIICVLCTIVYYV